MIDMTKKYRTRDGRDVRIYATDGCVQPVHGAFARSKGEWLPMSWGEDGKISHNGTHNLDLIEVKPERVVWINEYPDGGLGEMHAEKRGADDAASFDAASFGNNRAALHRVVLSESTVWKEGDAE